MVLVLDVAMRGIVAFDFHNHLAFAAGLQVVVECPFDFVEPVEPVGPAGPVGLVGLELGPGLVLELLERLVPSAAVAEVGVVELLASVGNVLAVVAELFVVAADPLSMEVTEHHPSDSFHVELVVVAEVVEPVEFVVLVGVLIVPFRSFLIVPYQVDPSLAVPFLVVPFLAEPFPADPFSTAAAAVVVEVVVQVESFVAAGAFGSAAYRRNSVACAKNCFAGKTC